MDLQELELLKKLLWREARKVGYMLLGWLILIVIIIFIGTFTSNLP